MRVGLSPVIVGLVTLAMGCGASATEPMPPTGGSAKGRPHPVKVELIAEHASVLPGGNTRVGVHFELEEDWHIYAKTPGDAGLPTSIEWTGSAGTTFWPVEWPDPQEFLDPGNIRTFGYSGAVTLASVVKAPRTAKAGTSLPIRAKVKWLACHDICIPGAADLELALPVADTQPVPSTHSELFAQVAP
ncbi:MAG: hypothetical protein COV75_01160 [Candidatus Omnitrophica bacterium CG11_big_fil_rev_8_21_14_0_20_63_9]|nr:MAG: hypothetical protein COV75_01160 [Candidatus Omnitrophica bacterium CG11_big_fil_rev_8_21_14_0_20_63_9]